MTLISDCGCPGLTDNPFHGKMGISKGSSRSTDNSLSGSEGTEKVIPIQSTLRII